jgi:hypothetical protein
MFLSYGGDPTTATNINQTPSGAVTFNVPSITDFNLVSTYDEKAGVDFQWFRMQLRANCILNNSVNIPGQTPIQSELQLIQLLSKQRQVLRIWMADAPDGAASPYETLLFTPNPGSQTDAQFGPQCIVHSIRCDIGSGSLMLDLQFIADISPCGSSGMMATTSASSPSLLVSNRWKYSVFYKPENGAEVRVIDGLAVFRMDELLKQLNGIADSLRLWLIPAKTAGYQRYILDDGLQVSEGGTTYKYTIVDEQVSMSVPNANPLGIANIFVDEERSYTTPSALSTAIASVPTSFVDKLTEVGDSALKGGLAGSVFGGPGIAAGAAIGGISQVFAEAYKSIKEVTK